MQKFWKTNNFLSYILTPISLLYFIFYKTYKLIKKVKVCNVPIICVGNVTIGGAGKTPFVIALRELLSKNFSSIFILTRGYKGKKKGPILVDDNSLFNDVGDESLLHHQQGKTCVAKNKIQGAKFCEKLGSDLIIMDDGLQSIDIKKDIKIVIIDGNYGFGNKNVIPSGPLRETVEECINRSDIVINIGSTNYIMQYKSLVEEKLFIAQKHIDTKKVENKKLFVFSALGNNENFHKSLIDKGHDIVRFKCFPDHYLYRDRDLQIIVDEAKENNLTIVCTYKDFVKVPKKYKNIITPIKLSLIIKEKERLKNKIIEMIT